MVPGPEPVANIRRRAKSSRLQEIELAAMSRMNQRHLASRADDAGLAARMKSFETAFGMQAEMPEVFDLSKESTATLVALRPRTRQHGGFRLAVLDRTPARRARGALCRADRFRLVKQLGRSWRHAHA